MSIGIIGAGALGSNVARLLAKSGHFGDDRKQPRPRKSLAELVGGSLGPSIKAGTVEEAASADIVLVAVRWVDLEKALDGLPAWKRPVFVIDGTNSRRVPRPGFPRRQRPEQSASPPMASRRSISTASIRARCSASLVSGPRVSSRPFNHLDVQAPAGSRQCRVAKRVLFYSGDDVDAKAEIRKIIERTGHFSCRTLAASMWVDHWPGYRSASLAEPSTSSRSDGQRCPPPDQRSRSVSLGRQLVLQRRGAKLAMETPKGIAELAEAARRSCEKRPKRRGFLQAFNCFAVIQIRTRGKTRLSGRSRWREAYGRQSQHDVPGNV